MDNSIVYEVCAKTVFWKDWNFWLALATAGAAIIALWQTKNNRKQDDISQRQNTGLNLLPLRKEILENVKKGEFNDIYWDAAILFSDPILRMIEKAMNLKSNYQDIEYRISFIEDFIKENSDEDFWRYGKLCDGSDGDPALLEELYQLTDKYNRTTTLPGESTPSVLVFRDLYPKYRDAKRAYDSYSVVVFNRMQNEIRKSIIIDEHEENKGIMCKITAIFKSMKKNSCRKVLGRKWINKPSPKRLFWILIVLLILVFALHKLGFNITYDPTIITDWNAVSGCAAWAGVIASAVAVIYAIRIPKEIADRQNKIALFDKRFSVYSRMEQFRAFAQVTKESLDEQKEDLNITELINQIYAVTLHTNEEYMRFIRSEIEIIKQMPLLFPEINGSNYEKMVMAFYHIYCDDFSAKDKSTQENLAKNCAIIIDFVRENNDTFMKYLMIETDVRG